MGDADIDGGVEQESDVAADASGVHDIDLEGSEVVAAG